MSKTVLQASDKKKGVQDFFQIYGNDPRAAELLHDGILDNFSAAVMKSGQYNPKAAKAWLAKHSQAMGELPETAKFLGDSQKAGEALLNRKLMMQAQRKVLDRTLVAKIAKSDQPELVVQQAVRDPKMMKALMVGAITEDGQQAVARAVADTVRGQANPLEYLRSNEASLKPVMEKLKKGHWQNLLDVVEAEGIVKRVTAPTAVFSMSWVYTTNSKIDLTFQGLVATTAHKVTIEGRC